MSQINRGSTCLPGSRIISTHKAFLRNHFNYCLAWYLLVLRCWYQTSLSHTYEHIHILYLILKCHVFSLVIYHTTSNIHRRYFNNHLALCFHSYITIQWTLKRNKCNLKCFINRLNDLIPKTQCKKYWPHSLTKQLTTECAPLSSWKTK